MEHAAGLAKALADLQRSAAPIRVDHIVLDPSDPANAVRVVPIAEVLRRVAGTFGKNGEEHNPPLD
jgi:hypothetical protein